LSEAALSENEAPAAGEEEQPQRAPLRATLARLRIAGFKSFADATVVEVLPGLTGIVGPNGCGKSNVVEALRWAMGETSARSMRGGEMDDVIFAGTSLRPGRNLAEVSLFLEDAEGLAPPPHADAPELEIVRRIARGEGSAFRVNGREVRARDVQTMFADLGSGARASAMVSQGKVAAMIGAKPEERRQVLEEAAGISGLRARRHEAELKLRQAEANLTRAEDLLNGLGRPARLAPEAGAAGQPLPQFVRIGARRRSRVAFLAARARRRGAGRGARALDAAQAARSAPRRGGSGGGPRLRGGEAIPAPREAEAAARTALERHRVEARGWKRRSAAPRTPRRRAGRLERVEDDLGHAEKLAADAARPSAAWKPRTAP
jgi:chromosome segregation protein